MRLFLIRHGYTENRKGDVRLSEKGILQSKELSKKLGKLKIGKVYTSDLIRSKETVKEYTNTYIEDKRLREIYRLLVGGPEKEGTSPERKIDDEKRANEFFEEILKEEENIALFCHGNIIRFFLNKILKSKENVWERLIINNCSVSIIEKNKSGLFIRGINLNGNFEENIKELDNIYLD